MPAKKKPGPPKPAAGGSKTKGGGTTKAGAKAEAKPSGPALPPKSDDVKPLTLGVKALSAFIVKDAENIISKSPWWPYVVDETEIAARFLRHADCNFISGLEDGSLEPEKLRMALLGSLRYGKPFVFDMSPGADLYDKLKDAMDAIYPGLLIIILNKDILKEDNIEKLVKDSDPTDYKITHFDVLHDFRFVVLTSGTSPTGFTGKMMPVTIE